MDPDVVETGQPYVYTGDDPVNEADPSGLSTGRGIGNAYATLSLNSHWSLKGKVWTTGWHPKQSLKLEATLYGPDGQIIFERLYRSSTTVRELLPGLFQVEIPTPRYEGVTNYVLAAKAWGSSGHADTYSYELSINGHYEIDCVTGSGPGTSLTLA